MPSNHLIHEKSPYLQQHAHNPVDWYPWSPEALAKAQRENKPIFLSVGYSTCHWCHVMEHESFENERIAAILNKHFVSIKVDREERPDIDRIYMAYVQASTGSGGWPMSVWLTPDGKPFVGGTYFPPDSRYGRPGFGDVLERIAEAWSKDHDRILESSARMLAELEKHAYIGTPGEEADAATLDIGFSVWRRSFDSQLGGFGQAPKFPRPAVLDFLLRYSARAHNDEAQAMTAFTLKAMARGGMNDQLGGGFHRYSVDEYWFVPHFEKMLYDQAQLVSSLMDAFQLTRDEAFSKEARRVLDYVLRDMTSPEGGFYSAEDADSAIDAQHPEKKSEGAFYLWTASEISSLVGDAAARLFQYRYGVEPHGNVRNDPHGEFEGRNILFEAHTVEETAHHFERPTEEVRGAIEEACRKLLDARSKRPRPHLDDKILTSWNGLMISAFSRAGAVLEEPRYIEAGHRSAHFLRDRMWSSETRTLLRRYRLGEAAIPGFLDDYASFIRALTDLYEAAFDVRDLELALELAARMIELFEDKDQGGFFSTSNQPKETALLLRMKDDYDGAEPSGNSVAALALLRLERMTGRTDLGDAARRTIRAFSGRIRSQPFGVPLMMCALDLSLAPPQQVVLAGEKASAGTEQMLLAIRSRFEPHRVVLLADRASRPTLGKWNEAIGEMHPIEGRTAAYVCENFTCRLPVTEAANLAGLLHGLLQ
jgi:hypothetical protein